MVEGIVELAKVMSDITDALKEMGNALANAFESLNTMIGYWNETKYYSGLY